MRFYLSLLAYNMVIYLYGWGITLSALFRHKARLWVTGRRNMAYPDIAAYAPNRPRFWVHCASLGEFEQGRPVIEALKQTYPDCLVWLTFYSPSGYEVRKHYALADWVGYMPLDTAHYARRFVAALQPTAALFVKYEFWYHHLHELQQKEIPAYLISAQFNAELVFFKPYGTFFRQLLSFYRHIFVQTRASEQLLHQIGINNVTVAGDTRFDRVKATAKHAIVLPIIGEFKGHSPLLVAGSTWQADETLLASLIADSSLKAMKWVIAPHEIDPSHITKLHQTMLNTLHSHAKKDCLPADLGHVLLYSNVAALPVEQRAMVVSAAAILIIDNIGILSSCYGYADYAYIGGGFGRGIHNILEAAVFGIPIFFGSEYHSFQEANDLIALKGAFSVQNAAEIIALLNRYPRNSDAYRYIKNTCQQYVADRCGATEILIKYIKIKKI